MNTENLRRKRAAVEVLSTLNTLRQLHRNQNFFFFQLNEIVEANIMKYFLSEAVKSAKQMGRIENFHNF